MLDSFFVQHLIPLYDSKMSHFLLSSILDLSDQYAIVFCLSYIYTVITVAVNIDRYMLNLILTKLMNQSLRMYII